jgi:drug/metabolite transporter (DMT)-like permease
MSTAAGAKSTETLAFAALVAGAAMIACAPILVRLSDTSPGASAFWRVALSAPALALWARAEPGARRAAPVSWTPLVLAGLCFAGDLAAWHVSILYTSVANATLEANFAPVFVTAGAWLLWRERPSAQFVGALGLTALGAALLIAPNFALGGRTLAGDALGVLTAVFYAGYMLALKSATSGASTARIMAVSTAVAAAALLPYALATAEVFRAQDARGWMVLAALALVPQVGGQSLIAFGFARLPASLSAVSLLLQPLLAALYAWLLLGEAMSGMQMAGAAVVLAGIHLARRGG